jgi:ABC-2 type transport system ATP-binding protein
VDVMSEVLAEKASRGVPVIFSSHQLDLVERLCHRVGIVVRVHMQEFGSVDELRAGGGTELVVHPPQARPGWADDVFGVVTAQYAQGRTVLTVAPGTEDVVDQSVLAAAMRTGPLHGFSRSQLSLSELFREVVAA